MDELLIILVLLYGAPILVAAALAIADLWDENRPRDSHNFEVVDISYREPDQSKIDKAIRYLDLDGRKKKKT